jgi:hypothetical protein
VRLHRIEIAVQNPKLVILSGGLRKVKYGKGMLSTHDSGLASLASSFYFRTSTLSIGERDTHERYRFNTGLAHNCFEEQPRFC